MQRFEDKYMPIPETGCWEWIGTMSGSGYGQIWMNDRMVGAHRVSWELEFKCEVPNGMCILHKCDNPSCVNPEHLFLGSYRDNMLDMIAKDRHPHQMRKKHG